MAEQRDNSAALFRNDRKREGKNDADFTGSATVGGMEYWVDMWTKPPREGKKGFFSLSFRLKEPRHSQQSSQPRDSRAQRPSKHAMPPPPGSEPENKPDPKTGEYGW